MRRWLLCGVAAVAVVAAVGPARAVIPVTDIAAISQLVKQVQDQIEQYALQIAAYATQIKQYFGEEWSWLTQAQQYAVEAAHYYNDAMMLMNFAHHPTLGAAAGLMNMAGLGNSLPFSPYAAMNLINGSSYGQGGFGEIGGILNSLSGFATSAANANRVYVPQDMSWASNELNSNANTLAGTQGVAMGAYQDYRNHLGVLPTLRQNAATATSTKDALDTANQLQAEIAWSNVQNGQVFALATMAAIERDTRVQRDEERLACELEMFRNGGGACPSGNNGAVAGGGGGANGGSDTMPVPPVPPLPANVGNAMAANPDPPMPVPPQPVTPPPAYDPPAAPPAPIQAQPPPKPQQTND